MTYVKRTKRAKPDPELVKVADSLLAKYKKPEDLIGENGLLKQLTKAVLERAMGLVGGETPLAIQVVSEPEAAAPGSGGLTAG